ncbi:MAG: hypothetical protein M1820_001481 [Bogoriella megaspora]|nr:MAG: hypothetical protein M1820_001481 [Bogoriella megaspora]
MQMDRHELLTDELGDVNSTGVIVSAAAPKATTLDVGTTVRDNAGYINVKLKTAWRRIDQYNYR